jgi:ADP-heptose:LPS heptosyltransferase
MYTSALRFILTPEKHYFFKILTKRKRRKLTGLGDIKNILCLQMNAIGDVLMTRPALSLIHLANADMTIDLVCKPHVAHIMSMDRIVSEVFPFSPRRFAPWHFKNQKKLKRLIIKNNYDLVVDFTGLPLTAAICAKKWCPPSLGFNRKIRTGMSSLDLSLAYDRTFDYSDSQSLAEMMISLVRPLGNGHNGARYPFLELNISAKKSAKKILQNKGLDNRKFVLLHPGGKWPPKRWPPAYFRRLAEMIVTRWDIPCVFLGNSEDRHLIDTILEKKSDPQIGQIISDDLAVSASIISVAAICICNDSAAMHIAASVRTPSVAIFGPVHPQRSAPLEEESCTPIYAGMFCSPCTLYYTRNRCKRGLNFCMQALKPEYVLEKVDPSVISAKL